MFLTIFKKELHLHVLSFRFLLCFVLLLSFALSTAVVCHKRASAYEAGAQVQKRTAEELINFYLEQAAATPERLRPRYPFLNKAELEEIAKRHRGGAGWRYFYEGGVKHVRAPLKGRYLVNGVADLLPRMILHSLNTDTLFAYDRPIFLSGGGFVADLLFVVLMVASLMGILMSYDAICGEREDGTLKLELASPLPRAVVFLAKFAAGIVLLAGSLAVSFLGALLYVAVAANARVGSDDVALYLVMFLTSLLYVAVFFALGLFVSTCSRRKSTALIAALFVWVTLVFVWPNCAIVTARALRPTPTYHKVQSELKAIEQDYRIKLRRLRRSGLWGFNDEYKSKARRYAAERIAEERDLWKMYGRIQKSQVSLAAGLGRLSPAFSLTLADSEQAGTGLSAFWKYFRNLQRYQDDFKAHTEAVKKEHGSWFHKTKPGWLKKDEISRPHEVRFSVAERVNASVLDIALLAFETMFLFMLSFIKFLRYEV